MNFLSNGVQEHLGSNLKVQTIEMAFNYLTTPQKYFILFAGGSMFLGILPWYSWFIGLFSIPVAIFDIFWFLSAFLSYFFMLYTIPALF